MRRCYQLFIWRMGICAGTALALVLGGCANTIPVKIVNDGSALQNQQMTSKWRLIGLVGDVVELNDGEHQIRLQTLNAYNLNFVVRVSGKKIAVTSAESHLPNCMPGARITWPIPTVKQSGTDEIPEIVLADPVFGEHREVESCAQAVAAGCTLHKLVLVATSEPIGAEIWINGKKQPYRTNTTLSVPFCVYSESIDVLLRADNAINCLRKVSLVPDQAVYLHCHMKMLK